MKNIILSIIFIFIVTLNLFSQSPLYPTSILKSEAGYYMSQKGDKKVVLYEKNGFNKIKEYTFSDVPTGVEENDKYLFVTTFSKWGNLEVIDKTDSKSVANIKCGSGTCSPIYIKEKNMLVVLNQFSNDVVFIDADKFNIIKRTNVLREPKSAVYSDKGYLFVTNFLPSQRADLDTVTACISVIDINSFKKVKDIPMDNGSNAVRGIAITEDGKYVLATHNLGRFQVPTNQLQQGWMNTSAVSVISVDGLKYEGSVLLDEPERGAAGIWDVKCGDGKVVISHSGTHDVSIIDYDKFIKSFENAQDKSKLSYDLTFLYDKRTRVPLVGNGPRNIVIDNGNAIVPTYFSDTLNIVGLKDKSLQSFYPLQPGRLESDIDKGEKYFNDAQYCFQNWQSCNGCHPGDGRMDAMNWDLMNDGIGNSKNCKSLLFSHVTPPSMISGIRATAELAVRKGFSFIQFCEVDEARAICVDEYLKSLKPVESPYRIDGKLSDMAQKGKEVFDKLNCGSCHSGPLFTDCKMYRIGENVEFEKGWDTPTLIEVWRTAPYLFDGRAATLNEVFEKYKHGIDKKVSKKEIEQLVEYVKSL